MERREVEFRSLDGARRLMAEDTGPLDSTVLVFHAGTPGTRVMPAWWLQKAHDRGIRHVTYSRPGCERSERMRGRIVADCADDVLALIETLGADRIYNVGGSGGGPHALAFAALHPERIHATAALSSTAPPDAEGLNWGKGMCEANRVELDQLRRGDEALGEYIAQAAQRIMVGDEDPFDGALSEADQAMMDGARGEFFEEAGRRAVRNSIWGWFDDQKALWGMDWGFDLEAVAGPLAIWQGGQDRMVPPGHSRWLATKIPGAAFHFLPDVGHPSLYEHYYPAILDSLIGAAQASRLRFPAL